MATCNSDCDPEDKRAERRKQVMLGDLPSDFLRVTPISAEQQLALDEQAALALQQQLSGNAFQSSVAGRLTISLIEAKLNKNYGLTRMDPYVRIKVGQTTYETNTDYNGARNPRWNKNFNCFFYPQDTTIHIEIFDECSFSLDEKIAWGTYEIPENVLHGETADVWVELSGKLGEEKEGVINIVVTCQPIPSNTLYYHSQPQPVIAVLPYGAYRYKMAKGQNPDVVDSNLAPQEQVSISEEDLKQIKEMFPNIEDDVIHAVLEDNSGSKDQTINALLALSEGT